MSTSEQQTSMLSLPNFSTETRKKMKIFAANAEVSYLKLMRDVLDEFVRNERWQRELFKAAQEAK